MTPGQGWRKMAEAQGPALRRRPSWGAPKGSRVAAGWGVPHRKAGLPSTCRTGPSGTVLPLLSLGRRLDMGPHLFTSSPPGAVRYTRGPGTSQSQPRSRQGCRAAEPSTTRCHRHEQARLCPAVKVTPKAARQLAGRRVRPRHGPALSFPQKHCSGQSPQHTQEGASSPPGHSGHGQQPPRRFLQAGISSLGVCSGGILAEPESLERATVRPHPGGRDRGPRTTEGAPDSRLALGAVAWEVPP